MSNGSGGLPSWPDEGFEPQVLVREPPTRCHYLTCDARWKSLTREIGSVVAGGEPQDRATACHSADVLESVHLLGQRLVKSIRYEKSTADVAPGGGATVVLPIEA